MLKDVLARWAVTERSWQYQTVFVLVAFVVALGLRYALRGDLPAGFPYLTFFPAVIITAFIAGTRAGLALGLLCGVAAWYYFIAPFNSFALSGLSALALGFYILIILTDIALIHVMAQVLVRLRDERRRSESLAVKSELMFHELQHRVSNNLQVAYSMLQLQRRGLSDAAAVAALDMAAARLNTISAIQRRLHDPHRQTLDFARFLKEIVPEIVSSSAIGVDAGYAVDAEPVPVTADQAVPLGLIAVEFVSNALEHATLPDTGTTLTVSLRALDDSRAMIEVRDNGAGVPEGFSLEDSPSLGLRIARQFAGQIGAELSIANERGAVSRVVFPIVPPSGPDLSVQAAAAPAPLPAAGPAG